VLPPLLTIFRPQGESLIAAPAPLLFTEGRK
jgi:hypothetical protein